MKVVENWTKQWSRFVRSGNKIIEDLIEVGNYYQAELKYKDGSIGVHTWNSNGGSLTSKDYDLVKLKRDLERSDVALMVGRFVARRKGGDFVQLITSAGKDVIDFGDGSSASYEAFGKNWEIAEVGSNNWREACA